MKKTTLMKPQEYYKDLINLAKDELEYGFGYNTQEYLNQISNKYNLNYREVEIDYIENEWKARFSLEAIDILENLEIENELVKNNRSRLYYIFECPKDKEDELKKYLGMQVLGYTSHSILYYDKLKFKGWCIYT